MTLKCACVPRPTRNDDTPCVPISQRGIAPIPALPCSGDRAIHYMDSRYHEELLAGVPGCITAAVMRRTPTVM